MARDYFAILGLSPGRYDSREITRRFVERRSQLLATLADPATHAKTRQQLEDLHLAYRVLRDPQRQSEYLAARAADEDRLGQLRRMIAASLEDGLLRYSRRQMILEHARKLGLSDFQAQVLIAQVQFGDGDFMDWPATPRATSPRAAVWRRAAAVGVLGLAMFLYLLHRVGV